MKKIVSFGERLRQNWFGQGCEERVCWQVCTQPGPTTGANGFLTAEKAAVAFSADKKQIVSGSEDCLVKIWDTGTAAEVSTFLD